MEIAGNTFDYSFIHGKAIQAAGKYSFVSCSDEAVENGIVTLEDYPIVDYILGLEKEDPATKAYYKTFSSPMQRLITSYCQSGGNLFVSGAYVGSDMSGTQGNREFTEKILKYGNQPAGIAYKGADYRTFVLGFPFESIQSETDRASIMAGILGFFTQK